MSFSPCGKILASGSNDSIIKLWDVELKKEKKTLEGHGEPITEIIFNSKGTVLVSGEY